MDERSRSQADRTAYKAGAVDTEAAQLLQISTTPTLLLMAGLAGTGKTELASVMSAKLNWRILNRDKLKYALLEKGVEAEQAGWIAFEQLFTLIKEALLRGESVIIDTSNEKPFVFENI